MGCIYSHDGICEFYDKSEIAGKPMGCDKNGNCVVEDDPIPSNNCESYESDWSCSYCGADMNSDEACTCED